MSDLLNAILAEPANYRLEEPTPEDAREIFEHFGTSCFDEGVGAEAVIVYAPTARSLETDDWNDMRKFYVAHCFNDRAGVYSNGDDDWTDATSALDAVVRVMTDSIVN